MTDQHAPAPAHVFVLGDDEHNARLLAGLPDAQAYRFHTLLSFDEMRAGDEIPLNELLDTARQRLDASTEPIDAIIGFWDFPVSTMLPILRARHGLPGPTLDQVVKCEHKYWSRLEQAKVITEYPAFGLVDPEHDTDPPPGVGYPLWVKPVKSFSSVLAFRAADRAEFGDALTQLRAGVGRVGAAFDALLEHLRLPDEIAAAGGRACLAEEAITGAQVTVEGYMHRGAAHVYGVVDSVRYENSSSFLRYQYPSSLPTEVSLRMAEIARAVVEHIGLNGSTFNVEFFWDPDTDTIRLLEVNPRHSQSHAELFEQVDGVSNHQAMLRLALGRDPDPPRRQGDYAMASEWFVRRFADGVVRRVPTPEEIERVEAAVPGVTVQLAVAAGDRLSELHEQDSYSYHLASIWIGGADEAELASKFAHAVSALTFHIDT